MIFGLDISHHQDLNLNLGNARRDGIEFVFIKATEGSGFVDSEFKANLAEARAAGQLVAAYHYYRSNASAAAQVEHIKRTIPRDVPVIPDVEANSGPIAPVKTFVGLLRMAGYQVPLLYLPRWYWQQIGSPDLSGLPPLWSSRYPDNVVGTLPEEWADVPAHYWNGYGGLDVAVLQFTSSARVAGYAPLDANAYRGTREQLAQLLQGTREDDDVKNLIIAREKGTLAVWVGDLVTRRWIPNEGTLADVKHWIGERGGDPTVYEFANIAALGAPIEATIGTLTNDEANVLAAIRALPAPGEVDVEALAAALAPVVGPMISAGATPEQVEEAIRRVFADGGTADDDAPENPTA